MSSATVSHPEGHGLDLVSPLVKPKKRRNRRPKACQACRARKVRCDYGEPCSTCRSREHPHLCIYTDIPNPRWSNTTQDGTNTRLSPRAGIGLPNYQASNRNGVAPQDPPIRPTQSHFTSTIAFEDAALIRLLNYVAENISELSERDGQTGETLHFGRNSMPAFFQCLLSTQNDGQQILPPEVSIGSAFGLANRTPLHPFGSLWAATAKITLGDILGTLPGTEQCMRYYRAYAQIALPFAPYLLDPDGFERRLLNVIQLIGDRSDNPIRSQAAAQMPYEDLGWYALLFAVLASGCQFADEASSERILTTRVFVACSFECLRLANFYVLPSPESIQTMLILEYVIANDSNPGVGWAFMTLCARQAESRGLHMLLPGKGRDGAEVTHPLWRAVIHMDSIMAFAFDRRLLSFLPAGYDAANCISSSFHITFHDLSHAVSCLRLQWQTMRTNSFNVAVPILEVQSYLARLEHIRNLAEDNRSSLKEGVSMQSKLEQLVLVIHLKHLEAEIHRVGAVHTDTTAERREQWSEFMVANYVQVVEAYLFLKPLSPIAVTWDVWFCGISATLVLAGLQMVRKKYGHEALLQSMVEALVPASHLATMEGSPDNTTTSCRTAMQVIKVLLERSRIGSEDVATG